MQRRDSTATLLGPLAVHLDRPLVAIDVGCRDAEAANWLPFEPNVQLIGFEPDPEECARLQREMKGPADRRFVPVALGARPGEAVLHLTRHVQSSSLYEPDPEAIERHPELQAHEEVGRRTVAVTTLDAWGEQADAGAPDLLKLDVQGAELDVLRGAERALTSVRAIEVEVEFQPLYRDQPLFHDVDAHLRTRGFVLWRLRGLRHLSIAGAEPASLEIGGSLLPDDVEREPSGGRLSWADAIYVREDLARPSATSRWTDSARDACVAAALGLPELARVSLGAARASAPIAATNAIDTALSALSTTGFGRPEEVSELERLRVEVTVQNEAATARASVIEDLTVNRDWAYGEIEQLRERVEHLESGGELPSRRLTLPALQAARRRVRQWTAPRVGVLRHHSPVPIRVPRRQLRARPPHEAPSISIVTPSLNQGRFIERTIRSVLDQDYPALEYVIQDGRSSDGTQAVLDAYRVRLAGCYMEVDDGQADAINRGFTHTSGEIMGWLNSDDVLLPGALAVVARHFADNPDTDVVYGHRLVIDEADHQVGCWILPRHDDWMLDYADLVPQETMFWRRSAWEAAGGRLDTSYDYALDWDLLLRFVDAGARIVRLPLPLGGFRVHDLQKTTARLDVGLGEIEAIRAARNGQPVSHGDAWERLRPYLRRHVASHIRYRIAARLPGLHVPVSTP